MYLNIAADQAHPTMLNVYLAGNAAMYSSDIVSDWVEVLQPDFSHLP